MMQCKAMHCSCERFQTPGVPELAFMIYIHGEGTTLTHNLLSVVTFCPVLNEKVSCSLKLLGSLGWLPAALSMTPWCTENSPRLRSSRYSCSAVLTDEKASCGQSHTVIRARQDFGVRNETRLAMTAKSQKPVTKECCRDAIRKVA